MEKYEFPLTFACPHCGCKDTIARLLYSKAPGFIFLDREAKPLEDPRLAVLSVRMMVRYWDQCAKCGREYCTKVEVQNAPVKAIPKGKAPGQGQKLFRGR